MHLIAHNFETEKKKKRKTNEKNKKQENKINTEERSLAFNPPHGPN